MRSVAQRTSAMLAMLALLAPGVPPLPAQDSSHSSSQVSNTPQGGFVLKANADLVLTNVVARDAKTGEVVKGLKQSDFKIYENGKEQTIDSFDFQSVDMAKPLNEATVSGLAAGPAGSKAVVVAKPEELRDHRLIVMFFDLTSMQPEDLERCVEAAQDFIKNKMQPADLVALVSFGDTLSVDQDFTADKNALINEVGAYNGTEGQGFAAGATANSNQVEDTTAYTPDEGEYNDLNTDRELFALRAVSQSLAKINVKKSLLYFSGGISRDGIENEASIRSAINAAVRADLAIYSVDTRGLQAIGPLGDASTGSLRGQGGFNGGALLNNMNSNFASQEVMSTLSTETGGTAFFDSNDFAPAFAKVQADNSAYYAIGFHSTNPARDGKFRKLTVKIDKPGIKLEYRPGYYAPADFKHSGKEDREQELEDQLASDLPATDIAVYMDAFYFRLDENRFFMPVSLVVPGSQIPFVKGGDKDKATLDVIGAVIDDNKRPVGRIRDTVKLNLDPSLQARQKNIQYTTSFNLPPGHYQLKFVVRRFRGNGTGRTDLRLGFSRCLPARRQESAKSYSRVHRTVPPGMDVVTNVLHLTISHKQFILLPSAFVHSCMLFSWPMPPPAQPLMLTPGATPHLGGLAGGSRHSSPGRAACTDCPFLGSRRFESCRCKSFADDPGDGAALAEAIYAGRSSGAARGDSGARPPAADHLTEGAADCGGHQEASAGRNKALERAVPGTSTAR